MPELTPRLGIKKPSGNENVTRLSLKNNWDIIDEKVETIDGSTQKMTQAVSGAVDLINLTSSSNSDPSTFMKRDENGQAKVKEPTENDHIARKIDVDTAVSNITPNLIGAAPISHTHSANDINSGTLADARIPNLNASKINAGTLADARIPSLNASKINAGPFHADRIPSLPASKITSGTFSANRIPNLSASKITSGTLPVSRGGTGGTSKSAGRNGLGIFVQSSRPSGASSGDLRAW